MTGSSASFEASDSADACSDSSADFFAAVAAGDDDEVRRMLDDNPAPLSETGPDGHTPALTALLCGHLRLADELAARQGELTVFEAAAFDDTTRLSELVDADLAVVESWSADGWQPLHLAARFGRAESARILLDADAPVDLPAENAHRALPLHLAATGGHSEVVWILVASDAPIDARDNAGRTALMAAAATGDLDTVRALLAGGSDPLLTDDQGHTAAELSVDDAVRLLLG